MNKPNWIGNEDSYLCANFRFEKDRKDQDKLKYCPEICLNNCRQILWNNRLMKKIEKIEIVWSFNMENKHMNICKRLNEIYSKKNKDYGDSFHQSYLQYGPTVSAIRLEDKLNRFKNIIQSNSLNVKEESVIDTLLDLANYAIMTVMEMEE